jgi:hypothetical protein
MRIIQIVKLGLRVGGTTLMMVAVLGAGFIPGFIYGFSRG